jgi:signal transduction histidine kinase
MRHDDEKASLAPSPTLTALDRLVNDLGAAGLPVETRIEGEPVDLPHALELSAYRIIQEGLTNVLKHARATSATVTLQYLPEELVLDIRDDGQGPVAGDGLGHGLVGIGERVKIFGGQMTATTTDDGGFELRASLPLART